VRELRLGDDLGRVLQVVPALYGGSGYPNFLAFLERWPVARTYRDKLLAIDWLMHQCHSTAAFPLGRPIAVNLIEGNAHEVAAFLDELAYGTKSTPGLESTRDAWRAGAGRRWKRHSGPGRVRWRVASAAGLLRRARPFLGRR
jgi:hypothetical protein